MTAKNRDVLPGVLNSTKTKKRSPSITDVLHAAATGDQSAYTLAYYEFLRDQFLKGETRTLLIEINRGERVRPAALCHLNGPLAGSVLGPGIDEWRIGHWFPLSRARIEQYCR